MKTLLAVLLFASNAHAANVAPRTPSNRSGDIIAHGEHKGEGGNLVVFGDDDVTAEVRINQRVIGKIAVRPTGDGGFVPKDDRGDKQNGEEIVLRPEIHEQGDIRIVKDGDKWYVAVQKGNSHWHKIRPLSREEEEELEKRQAEPKAKPKDPEPEKVPEPQEEPPQPEEKPASEESRVTEVIRTGGESVAIWVQRPYQPDGVEERFDLERRGKEGEKALVDILTGEPLPPDVAQALKDWIRDNASGSKTDAKGDKMAFEVIDLPDMGPTDQGGWDLPTGEPWIIRDPIPPDIGKLGPIGGGYTPIDEKLRGGTIKDPIPEKPQQGPYINVPACIPLLGALPGMPGSCLELPKTHK